MELTPEMQQWMHTFFEESGKHEKADKLERYKRLNQFARKGQILFCGSSLMEQFPIYELQMDLGLSYTIYNRGVGGFTTTEMLDALDTCVFALEPRYIFINIGTNDLNGPDYTEEGLIARYEEILRRIKEKLPEARLYLLAYYPVNDEVGMQNQFMAEVFKYRTNARIVSANKAVEALAAKMGGTFLDLNAGITDEAGRMKKEYTIEGMHMYADGYYQVLQALKPVLEEIGR